MIALKAKYDNGTIVWEDTPSYKGCFDVMVILSKKEIKKKPPSPNIAKRLRAIKSAQEYFTKDIPREVSLVDELIAERRREAARE